MTKQILIQKRRSEVCGLNREPYNEKYVWYALPNSFILSFISSSWHMSDNFPLLFWRKIFSYVTLRWFI